MKISPLNNRRVLSVDVFRGITMVLMIIVNSPGTLSPYSILQHALWDGCTLADVVFPSFLFIVGLSLVISLANKQEEPRKKLYKELIQRSVILFALGLFLNVFPKPFDLATLRVYGILQRIAVCYLICSYIYLNTTLKTQVLLFLVILWGYWFILTQISVPSLPFTNPVLGKPEHWVAYWDQLLFASSHLFAKTYDPEGFFSTLPSVATTLSGVLTGSLLITKLSKKKKWALMLSIGLSCLVLGALWDFSFAINKNLWTSSFVLWTTGISLVVFAFCYGLIDILGYTSWTLPFKIFGVNALFAFVLHVILLKIQFNFVFSLKSGQPGNLKRVITETFFSNYNEQTASLLYSFSFLALIFLVVSILYYHRIYIRV